MTQQGGNDRLSRFRALRERIGESLFYVPSMFMVGALVASQLVIQLDRSLGGRDLPEVFNTTVESSRVLLSVIAGGTITAASVVFSLTLVAVQLASTQFSPRTLGSFLGDRVQQVIIGLVLGTFVYCMLVLQVVRAPVEEFGEPFIPRFSVMLGVILGVVAMIAVIASINRTAQSLRVESVASRVTSETIAAIRDQFGDEPTDEVALQSIGLVATPPDDPPGDSQPVEADQSGWVQDINLGGIVEAVPEGCHVLIHRSIGTYVLRGQTLASVWPEPDDWVHTAEALERAFVTGRQRSRHGDVGFGITQLVDIAVRALSPGVNDPKTAEEIVFRLGDILVELAVRDLPPARSEIDGRTIILGSALTQEDYVDLAIEPIRRFARNDPRVLSTILHTLAHVRTIALKRRSDAAVAGLEEQARIILADSEAMDSRADRDLVIRTGLSLQLE